MRTITAICLSILLLSCFNNDRRAVEIDQLNQRIIRLEEKIDSLINGGNNNGLNLTANNIFREAGLCQATTKKGTQCKRKAKSNGYCWQHK